MYARKHIIPGQSITHVFFRCHNRQFLLKPECIKSYLISLWAKYKKKYGIKIYEFIILDNHAHLIISTPSSVNLGHFMRTVNSLLARAINKYFKRDSQAIRERYKSPLISNFKYLRLAIQYVWLNRYKIDKSNPLKDKFCSASWRFDKRMMTQFANNEKELDLLTNLLDFNEHIFPESAKNQKRVVSELLNNAYSRLGSFAKEVFSHSHTIGDS